MSALIVYYSRAGQNYCNGTLRTLPVGNTRVAAQMLHTLTGAPLFELVPVQPYDADYNVCINQAQQDQCRGARPAIRAWPDKLADSEILYLGYPNYWGTMPMVLFTFLEQADTAGKVICPFCTHEGGGLGRSEGDIRRLCPDATVLPGLALHGAAVARAGGDIARWVQGLPLPGQP